MITTPPKPLPVGTWVEVDPFVVGFSGVKVTISEWNGQRRWRYWIRASELVLK